MEVLLFLVPLSLLLGIGALIAFGWGVNDGQFDDLQSPPAMPFDEGT